MEVKVWRGRFELIQDEIVVLGDFSTLFLSCSAVCYSHSSCDSSAIFVIEHVGLRSFVSGDNDTLISFSSR